MISRRHLSVAVLTLTFLLIARRVESQPLPAGFSLPDTTLSPDGRYGVLVPVLAREDEVGKDDRNRLVEVVTGRTVAVIHAQAGWDRMNRGGVEPCRWSADGSLLLWEVSGKWSPNALVLLKLKGGELIWQVNLLDVAQRTILARTRQANPNGYRAAQRENAGNGSAYPDGFTVDVSAIIRAGERLSLPLKVRASLTANPKGLESFPREARVNSLLEGTVDERGGFTADSFRLGATRFPPFSLEPVPQPWTYALAP